MSTETPQQAPTQEDLEKALKSELRKQQDVVYAIVGGLAAAMVSAIIWAAITVSTGYQIGYMAVGVGLLVGFAVRYFGAGIDPQFGVIGAIMALLGCALGNLFSQLGFAAQQEGIGYFETLAFLNFDLIKEIYATTFSGMDVVFYGIAAYEGYRFAFRNMNEELVKAVSQGSVPPPPYASLRLPVAIVLFAAVSSLVFVGMNNSTGVRTLNYENGEKRAAGEMSGGRETGPWTLWYENGNVSAEGYYKNGNTDSTWIFYNDDGSLWKTGTYRKGLEDGEWISYHNDSTISEQGSYKYGRQMGPWTYNYENGTLSARGTLLLDKRTGEWEHYHENGHLASKGSYVDGEPTGLWTEWYEDGKKSKESEYDADGNEKILNSWSADGQQYVSNGNGEIKTYDELGTLIGHGYVREGFRTGTWATFYPDGEKQEEGEYRDNIYYVSDAWNDSGEKLITNGTGPMEYYYSDRTRSSYGKVNGGLKMNVWTTNYPFDEKIMSEESYVDGKRHGVQKGYSPEGVVIVEGQFVDDKRDGEWKWYQTDGVTLESVATYVLGKKDGNQMFYDSYGGLLKTEVYKNGKLVDTLLEL